MSAAGPSATNRRLTVIIAADIDSFRRGLHTAQRQLEATSRSMIAIGQNLAFSLGVPLAGVAVAAQKMAVDFETASDKIRTLTGVTTEEVKKLEGAVLQLSDHLGISQIQAMEAAYAVASAGIRDMTKIMEVLEQSTKGTVIGLGDQTTLTRVLTQIMQAYTKEGVNAARAMNALVLAVREGNFEAPEFAQSIGDIISIAAAMGIQIEAISAGIASYTKVSGDAAKATTGFRNILSDILSPSVKAQKVWDQLFKGGIGELRKLLGKDLIGTLKQVADALANQPEIADLLFDNVRGLEAFLSVFRSQGDDVLRIFGELMKESNALDKAWNQILESGKRLWGILTGQIQNLAVALGDELMPTFKDLVLSAAAFTRAIRPWIKENAMLLAQIAAITVGSIALLTALGVLGLAVATVGKGVVAIATAFSLLGAALPAIGAALISPWAAAAAAVGLFLGLAVQAKESFVGIHTEAIKTARGLTGTMAVVGRVNRSLQEAGTQSSSIWQRAWEAVFNWLKRKFVEFQLWVDRGIARMLENITLGLMAANAGSKDFLIPDAAVDGFVAALSHMQSSVRFWEQTLRDLENENKDQDILGLDALLADMERFKKEWTTPEELRALFERTLGEGVGGLNLGKVTGVGDGSDKRADALKKITDEFRDQSIELSRLRNQWTDFEFDTVKGLSTIADAAKEGGIGGEALEGFLAAYRKLREELQKEPQAEGFMQIAELIKNEARELGSLTARWNEFEKGTAEGLAAIDAAAAKFRLPIDEVDRYRKAYINLREEIEKQNRMIVIDIKSSLAGAIEQVTRGLLQGTRSWKDILAIFGDIGMSIIFDMFKQIIEKKIDMDAIVLPNFEKTIPEAIQRTVEELKKMAEAMAAGKGSFETITDADIQGGILTGGAPRVPPPKGTSGTGTTTSQATTPPYLDITYWLGRLMAQLREWFNDLFKMISTGIDQTIDAVVEAFTNLRALVSGVFAGVRESFEPTKTEKIVAILGQISGSLGQMSAYSGQTNWAGASGGIVMRPTRSLIGEAGPEAVIPLGKLSQMIGEGGNTNVIVNSPHPATVRQSNASNERRIEVIIDDTIARSFRTGGRAAQAMEHSFGVRRVGGTR